MRILLVDSDQDLVDLIGFALRRQGHAVAAMFDGRSVVHYVQREQPDLVLLSTQIGDPDGFALCRSVRENSSVPIILISPHGDETSLVRGYEAGADDYVVKPFSPRQLLLRMDVVARRSGDGHRSDALDRYERVCVGDLMLDPRTFEVRKNGVRIPVTRLEFRILSRLMRSAGSLVESPHLIDYAWQSPANRHPSILKTHISHIRRKLTGAGGVPMPILSIARVGYMLSCEAEATAAASSATACDRFGSVASPR